MATMVEARQEFGKQFGRIWRICEVIWENMRNIVNHLGGKEPTEALAIGDAKSISRTVCGTLSWLGNLTRRSPKNEQDNNRH